jgi:hypothetical protein
VERAVRTGDWSVLFAPTTAEVVDLRAWLERRAQRWDFLVEVEPVGAPRMASEEQLAPDPYLLQEELKELAELLHGWDELVGVMAHLALRFGVWRTALFASWEHYCEERLGMGRSTVDQRVALERRMQALPALREALRSRALSYEQAREVSRIADEATVAGWVSRAAGMTCIALRRAVDEAKASQMCGADGRPVRLRLRVPGRVESLLREAFRAARLRAGRWLTPAECLLELSVHFIRAWLPEVRRILKRTDEVMLRDRGLCQVPGCSRPADHKHHIISRAAGGPLVDWNEVELCAPHHLRGVHAGCVRVSGRAPDRLTWILGEREVAAAS